MGDSEKFETQGRAHARLKIARSNIATLNAKLLQYGEWFREVGGLVGQLIRDPTFKSPSYVKLSEHVKTEAARLLTSEEIARLVDELVRETEVAKALEVEIANF